LVNLSLSGLCRDCGSTPYNWHNLTIFSNWHNFIIFASEKIIFRQKNNRSICLFWPPAGASFARRPLFWPPAPPAGQLSENVFSVLRQSAALNIITKNCDLSGQKAAFQPRENESGAPAGAAVFFCRPGGGTRPRRQTILTETKQINRFLMGRFLLPALSGCADSDDEV